MSCKYYLILARQNLNYIILIILDTIIFYTTTTAMLKRSKESATQQIIVTFEKRATKSDIRFTSALSVKRQPYSLLTYKHKST